MAGRRRSVLIGAAFRKQDLPWLLERMRELRVGPRDLKVAVDGGADVWAWTGTRPDFAVGDWDSIREPGLLEGVPHLSLEPRKEQSDLAVALEESRARGVSEIVAFGVTGGLADQHLASLLELGNLTARAATLRRVSAFGPEAEYHFVAPGVSPLEHRVRRGARVSLFALGGPARGVTLSGLEFPLKGARLPAGSRGMSNRALRNRFRIEVEGGWVVVVLPRE